MHLLHWHEACIQQFTIPLVELCKGGMPLVLVHRCHASLTLAWDKYLIPLLSPWWVNVGEPSSLDLYSHMHLQSRLFRFSILMYALCNTSNLPSIKWYIDYYIYKCLNMITLSLPCERFIILKNLASSFGLLNIHIPWWALGNKVNNHPCPLRIK